MLTAVIQAMLIYEQTHSPHPSSLPKAVLPQNCPRIPAGFTPNNYHDNDFYYNDRRIFLLPEPLNVWLVRKLHCR